jgi:hypothetical protein
MIYITGCGRSGTTMVFDILRNFYPDALSLDEPRALYMQNGNQLKFDIWSKMANSEFERAGSYNSNIDKSDFFDSYISSIK